MASTMIDRYAFSNAVFYGNFPFKEGTMIQFNIPTLVVNENGLIISYSGDGLLYVVITYPTTPCCMELKLMKSNDSI